ncbi:MULTISPECIES: aspartyl-phosphate phosphatase Spo0E family protein [unclassified Paenibacillus]|uniref:aspartyl-phosphate phosphatase Spo0E family protein n=1 Tax=unclassified Paenibacillus TaxID=185978 RepID=UPI0008AE97B8|nr:MULTISPECIES: aspartyl-phosphate phosphatase Spo0E family protein [unclassified Paenibacillus]QLG39958.1 aspartyl-phosphate phosphatase Spo0E family protein [Paenibacillus sp. E222]SEN91168.1 Spo0E like sporulation regulatory protein [Paenibacillus sp. OK076]
MSTNPTIKEKIEEERDVLNKLVNIYGIEHPLVIRQSELLDELINQHNNDTKTSSS